MQSEEVKNRGRSDESEESGKKWWKWRRIPWGIL